MTTPPPKPLVGRLAFREEGQNWCAYYAKPDTMKDAMLLGSLSMGVARQSPALRRGFVAFMKDVVGLIFQDIGVGTVSWPHPPQAAPENERAGHG